MKKLLFLCITSSIIMVSAVPVNEDPTQQYLDKKAVPAIIHDAYYEAALHDTLPSSFKKALDAFGFKEDEIQFYTAVRMNKFVERVGNKLIILRPNFFLYLTEEEQAAYIGLQLASLRAGDDNDVGGSHTTFYKPRFSSFQKTGIGIAALALGALYHNQLLEQSKHMWPLVKNIVFSKGTAVIATYLATNGIRETLHERNYIKQHMAAQNEVVDHLGAEGLLSIRTKQVHWAYNNHSWLINKWYRLLGTLDLVYNPETALERLKKYAASKNN